MIQYYYEKCNNKYMAQYPFFEDKLNQIQKLSKKIRIKKIKRDCVHESAMDRDICSIYKQSAVMAASPCKSCSITKFYILGNIVWSNTLLHNIRSHHLYPSEYFIKTILTMVVYDDYITNPPIKLPSKYINSFTYIPLHYNKLLIIDALMEQGSRPKYLLQKNNSVKYIYSEHSGVITTDNGIIDNIIVSAESDRVDIGDNNIYLPKNTKILETHKYIFHTHPNTMTFGGRAKDGIIYEFPSSNDLFNFIKYHNEGMALLSLIVAPEGIYIIRPLRYQSELNTDKNLFYYMKKNILKLEKMAMTKFKNILNDISDPDIFHNNVGSDFTFIKIYNKCIKSANLFVEYYPRVKKNNMWLLRQVDLMYFNK